MKISGILLQVALVATLATSSTAALDVDKIEDFSDSDSVVPSLSGSFNGPFGDQFGGSQGGAPIDCKQNRLWDGSGSRFAGMGFIDGSYDSDIGSQLDDGSHGNGFPCGRRYPGSGSGGSGDSSGSHRGRRRRHFRGDVGDEYDFGSDDGSFDPFDASGSGSSSNGVAHHHRRHHHHGRNFGSGSGSYASDGSVGGDDWSWSGSFDSSSSRDFFPPRLPGGSQPGSGSRGSHRLRGSGHDYMN